MGAVAMRSSTKGCRECRAACQSVADSGGGGADSNLAGPHACCGFGCSGQSSNTSRSRARSRATHPDGRRPNTVLQSGTVAAAHPRAVLGATLQIRGGDAVAEHARRHGPPASKGQRPVANWNMVRGRRCPWPSEAEADPALGDGPNAKAFSAALLVAASAVDSAVSAAISEDSEDTGAAPPGAPPPPPTR